MQDIPAMTQDFAVPSILGMSIHKRIKERRLALDLSMEDVAAAVGVKAWQTVQQWEMEDGTAPKRSRLEEVARVLKTTPAYLLYGSPEQANSNSSSQVPERDGSKQVFQTITRDNYLSLPDEDRRMIETIIQMFIDRRKQESHVHDRLDEITERVLEEIRQERERSDVTRHRGAG